jgi:hypothetical protein
MKLFGKPIQAAHRRAFLEQWQRIIAAEAEKQAINAKDDAEKYYNQHSQISTLDLMWPSKIVTLSARKNTALRSKLVQSNARLGISTQHTFLVTCAIVSSWRYITNNKMQSSPKQVGPHQIPLLHGVPVDSESQPNDLFNMELSALVSKKGSPPQKLAGGCRNINSSELWYY